METEQSKVEELLERLKQGFPEAWIPEKKGDSLSGKFVQLESGYSQYGQTPIVVLENSENGKLVSLWLFGEALRSQFLNLRPQPGDTIAVVYLGKQKSKSSQFSYHNYRVGVDKESNAADWDSLATPVEQEPDLAEATDGDIPDSDIPF